LVWQAKIAAGKNECLRVHVDRDHAAARSRQHGGERAAAASDHQDGTRTLLQQQTENGVDIVKQAYTVLVGAALVILTLPVSDGSSLHLLFDGDRWTVSRLGLCERRHLARFCR